ncbi:hypothetical protein MT418_005440 [Batrachochytrium dendrobatidis]
MILSSSSDSISILEKRQTPPNEPNPSTSQQSSQNGAKPKSHFPEGPFGHILDGAPPLKAIDLGYDDDGTPLNESDPRCNELSTSDRCIRAAQCRETLDQKKLCLKHKKSTWRKIKSTISHKPSIPKSCHDITLEKVEAQAQKCKNLREEFEKIEEKTEQTKSTIEDYGKMAVWFGKKTS